MTAGGTSLVVQWLRFHAPNAGDPGSIPGQGNRSHMLQLKILHATTKTCHNQINKYVLKRKKNDGRNKIVRNGILVLYCSLKEYTFIIPWFLKLKNSGVA